MSWRLTCHFLLDHSRNHLTMRETETRKGLLFGYLLQCCHFSCAKEPGRLYVQFNQVYWHKSVLSFEINLGCRMLLLSCSCRSPSLEISQGQKLKGTSSKFIKMLMMIVIEWCFSRNPLYIKIKLLKKKRLHAYLLLVMLQLKTEHIWWGPRSEVQDYGTACFNGNNPALTSAPLISVEYLSKSRPWFFLYTSWRDVNELLVTYLQTKQVLQQSTICSPSQPLKPRWRLQPRVKHIVYRNIKIQQPCLWSANSTGRRKKKLPISYSASTWQQAW